MIHFLDAPTKHKRCKCHTNLTISLKNKGARGATNSSDSSRDYHSKKKLAKNQKVYFYDAFGKFDVNFEWHLRHFDPSEANFRRYLRHLSSIMTLSSAFRAPNPSPSAAPVSESLAFELI